MKLNIHNYAGVLGTQLFLILIDLCINTFIGYFRRQTVYQLVFFIVQDICLMLALTAMLLTFFSTYIFQAGLVELLYDRFRVTIIVCMIYLLLTTTLHIWSLTVKWKEPLQYNWSVGLHLLYIFQRFTSVLYYYLYKRAALRISDPRFHDTFQKIQRQIIH